MPTGSSTLQIIGGSPEVVLGTSDVIGAGGGAKGFVTNLIKNPDGAKVTLNNIYGTETYQLNSEGFAKLQNTLTNGGFSLNSVGTEAKFGLFKYNIDLFSMQGNFLTAHLLEGVVWGGILALGIKFLGPTLGLSEEQSNAAALATFGAITSGKLVYGLVGAKGYLAPASGKIIGLPPSSAF